jgi:hypothetical protein
MLTRCRAILCPALTGCSGSGLSITNQRAGSGSEVSMTHKPCQEEMEREVMESKREGMQASKVSKRRSRGKR